MNSYPKSQCIGSVWKEGSAGKLESFDPALGTTVWSGTAAGSQDVDEAITAAKKALKSWAQTSLDLRTAKLKAYADVLISQRQELAETISMEIGKPLWESLGEVDAMIQKVGLSLQAYKERCGIKEHHHPLGTLMTRPRPHGVVAVLGPFNFPGHLPNGHIVPAILAGNTVIFKPSELAPLTGQKLMLCWEKAELPIGVLNLLQGKRETGQLLASHPMLDGLFFTGSFITGQKLSQTFSETPGKILALEMGGNNPLIVSTVKDLEAAAYMILQSAYLTSGQRCSCARRLIVLEDIVDRLLPLLKQKIAQIRIGHYKDIPEPFMGPVVTTKTAQHVLESQQNLISLGGIPIIPLKHLRKGTGLLSPGLIDVTTIQNLPDEEIFGPLLQLIRVHSFAEAITIAQKTSYGLSAGLLSDSKEEYELFRDSIKAGIINWNVPLTGASSAAPFGGVGKSGNNHPSGYYAADYCSYPVASIEAEKLQLPHSQPPGLA